MTEEVREAIQELETRFSGHGVKVHEDGEGGAFVRVEGLDLGAGFDPSSSWVGFHITHPYPDADVYPHFIAGHTAYVGGAARPNNGYPEAISPGASMPGFNLSAIQLSRRSNRWNPDRDTAALKLVRILDWLRALK